VSGPRRDAIPPLRVERALRLLPDLEALTPLRALLVATSRADAGAQWASSGPYLTLGKRGVDAAQLRRRLDDVLEQITEHLSLLYHAYIDALEALTSGDPAPAVAALLRAGRAEQAPGRLSQARVWYEVALKLADELQDRRPEIEILGALGRLARTQGHFQQGARYFQRCLALAEAEFDQGGVAEACAGLGSLAAAQAQWGGARSWYKRGLTAAQVGRDLGRIGHLHHRLASVDRHDGDPTSALDHLREARQSFETTQDGESLARVLSAQGDVESEQGNADGAVLSYREGLAWARRSSAPAVECAILLRLAEFYLKSDRFHEAEEELRRAEQTAIAHTLSRRLVQAYTMMGRLRGKQKDETGFVFFEQAIELCRVTERVPSVEGRVYREYGTFRSLMGSPEEARAYYEKARAIFESLGETGELEGVEAELERIAG
jgi:tetratricopeptide (TPR) repeat protein